MMESSNYLDLSGKIQKREQSNFGGFSDIWRGTLRKHGADIEVAIKELRVRQSASSENAAAITERLKKRCFREVLLWRTLQHVNIVPLLGFAMDPSGNPVLISPWCPNGNVVHFLNSYPDANRPALALDAAEGLTYLHSIPVVHGDLKAENVLVDNSGRACLCDFGMSQFIDESARITGFTTTHANAGGTDRFLSPELLSDNPKTTTSDIWAFGCVVVQILTGQIPFEWITQKYAVIPAIMRGERPIKGRDGRVDQELWDCLEKCWTMDPEDRPEASSLQRELSQHKQRCL
ncbi:hypothetical protein FRC03_009686 [Tulasnella sp. 419]|nr:hypothetical protein FRC02_009261 [Tulasnella sp. 418]KAG8957928.1 hypothetical protein FRC03_009686 [Tulasnella sp. 419]